MSARPERRERGYVLGLVIHVVLLIAVLGMVVFLASRYRLRVDLTADGFYSLTGSTKRVLDRVDERLRIEAYFTPDDALPVGALGGRRQLRNILDEYVQQGRGRVVVQVFDPQSDLELRKKADRLGIDPQFVQDLEGSKLSNTEIYQGLRFLYGGGKQKVVPFVGFTEESWRYEALFTPLVKALTTAERTRIGVIQWPTEPPPAGFGARQEQPRGYGRILSVPGLTDLYDFVPVDLSLGQLVPDDLTTLLLFRPKQLTDRQKYAFDQFLMRGGRLVAFVDSDEVSIGARRTLQTQPVVWDAKGSSFRFLEQLEHYGAVVHDRFLVDTHSVAVPFGVVIARPQGAQVVRQMATLPMYPYWYMPAAFDWADRAEAFATRSDGGVDQALVQAYRSTFEPGIDAEHAAGLTPPEFFWPCAVDLAESLPAGVTGHVLMRSSPASLLQTPPQSLHPLGVEPQNAPRGFDMQQEYARFSGVVGHLMGTEPRQQHGLMLSLSGRFKSWFANRERPRRPAAAKPQPTTDPLATPIGEDPVTTGSATVGPELPSGEAAPAASDDEPPTLVEAEPEARLILIADATFLRDDLVEREYQQLGGPVSQFGLMFFANFLAWLEQDRDLFELRTKGITVDRRLRLVAPEEMQGQAPERVQELLAERTATVRLANVLVPPLLLIAAGLVALTARRASKRRFLARLTNQT